MRMRGSPPHHLHMTKRCLALLISAFALVSWSESILAQSIPIPAGCARVIRADVIALDQVFFWNRLGAVQPQGMIYALRRDVVPIDPSQGLVPGNVRLREDKRPRPLVLRMNVGDCIRIAFQNLLAKEPVDNQ